MMQNQPRSETNDQLRALAGGQLLTFGWREGMAAEEAKTYVEEALLYAREAGNRKHEVLLLGAYGRIIAASGTADEYVRLVREAMALTDSRANPEGALLLNGLLCQACSLAGLVDQALAANDAALAIMGDDGEPSAGVVLGLNVRQMVGFDVAHWVRCLRAKLLVAVGHLEDADAWLARLFQVDPARIEPIVQYIPHLTAVELAWYRGDAKAAKWHAGEMAGYAEKSMIPFVAVSTLLGQGISAATRGDFAAAERCLLDGLKAARQGRAGLENEARLLAYLADTYDRAADVGRAVVTAAEAIEAARRRTDRFGECHASIVGASAIVAAGGPGWRQEATELLNRASNLIDFTGAKIFQPMLRQVERRIN